jgi:glycosidase
MQWNAQAHGGFTSATSTPWMSVNPNHVEINAKSQIDDPTSTFSFWSSMLATRKKYKDILIYGTFELLDRESEKIVSYLRTSTEGEKILVLCNFSDEKIQWNGAVKGVQEVVLSNYGRETEDFQGEKVMLEAFEACALLL